MRILLTIFLFIPFLSLAQDSLSMRELTVGFGYGGIMAHNNQVYHLARSHPFQWNLEYRLKNPKRIAHEVSYLGIGVHGIDYQSEVLGQTLTIFGFVEPGLGGPFFLRIGAGAGWNSRPFHPKSNNSNLMIGSRLSGMMQARIFASFLQNKSWSLQSGIGLTHFSNGAWQLPNMGINHFYAFTSIGFFRKFRVIKQEPIKSPLVAKDWFASISASFSMTELYPASPRKYPVLQAQGRIHYRNGKSSLFAAGADLMYNSAIASFLRNYPEDGSSALMQGLVAGHTWMALPNCGLLSEAGMYLFQKNKVYPTFYQRYGIRYYFPKHLAAGVLLKTHLAKAECLELNLSYVLQK